MSSLHFKMFFRISKDCNIILLCPYDSLITNKSIKKLYLKIWSHAVYKFSVPFKFYDEKEKIFKYYKKSDGYIEFLRKNFSLVLMFQPEIWDRISKIK